MEIAHQYLLQLKYHLALQSCGLLHTTLIFAVARGCISAEKETFCHHIISISTRELTPNLVPPPFTSQVKLVQKNFRTILLARCLYLSAFSIIQKNHLSYIVYHMFNRTQNPPYLSIQKKFESNSPCKMLTYLHLALIQKNLPSNIRLCKAGE